MGAEWVRPFFSHQLSYIIFESVRSKRVGNLGAKSSELVGRLYDRGILPWYNGLFLIIRTGAPGAL